MRTTITLDEDAAATVEHEHARPGGSLKAVVNRLLRLGSRQPTDDVRIDLPVFPGRTLIDITDTSAVIADLDADWVDDDEESAAS